MKIHFNTNGQAEPYKIYLGDISGQILCALNGIQEDSVRLSCKLNNSYDLSFTVDRYIPKGHIMHHAPRKAMPTAAPHKAMPTATPHKAMPTAPPQKAMPTAAPHKAMPTASPQSKGNPSGFTESHIESNGYHLLDEFMRLYVENIGWFIMSAPSVSHDGNAETLSVNAQSIETELMHNDLRGFKVNYADTDSVEMLIPENVEVVDGTEIPKEQIKFCNPEKPELSLLHIILKFAGVKGWNIGYIDEIPKVYQSYIDGKLVEKTVQLKDEIGRFDVDNQNVYSFLTQDIERYFQCIISFDSQNMTINAYRPENIGKDTNVTIGFRNVQNSNSISVDEGSIYTRYRVSGDDDLSIRSVNFGSDVIEDLSYFLNTRYLSPDTITKYNAWKSEMESKRYEYVDAVRSYNQQLNVLSELMDRVPLDDCSTQWNKFSDEELLKAKDNYTAQQKGYEAFYTDEDGNFDETKLAASSDANDYFQIRDVILTSIAIEMENRQLPTSVGQKEYIKTWQTDWKLYGIDELQIHMDFYQTEIKNLRDSHFDLTYTEYMQNSETDPAAYPVHTRDTHETQHALYLDYEIQLDESISGSCANAYAGRTNEYKETEALSEGYLSEMTALTSSVDKENWHQDGVEPFTLPELNTLSKLYKDTDYTNKNMFITSFDDQVTQIDEELKLYQAAVKDLEAVSRPQYTYKTSLDNFITQYGYRQFTENLELGDFLYLAVTDDAIVKLRLISYAFNPCAMDEDLQIEFSNMVRTKSQRYDISYLLDLGGGSSKNSISGSSHGYGKNEGLSITQNLLNKLLSSLQYTNNVENLINQHFQSLIGQLVIAKSLEAEMITATKLEAEDGFFQYLQSALIAADKIVAESGIFGSLNATVGAIDGLLAGNLSAELGHIICLTAENAQVDEAFIREIIAAQITVSMLKAGDITLDNEMRILSDNGYLTMNGETLQIKGIKEDGQEYVAIQLGYSAAGKPALIICDETGAIMLDAKGLHESIIPDGLICSDMIGTGQIQKSHLSFQTVETDEDGNIDASKVLLDGKGLHVQFSSMEEEVTKVAAKADELSLALDDTSEGLTELESTVSGVKVSVDAATKSIQDEVWKNSFIETTDADGNVIKKRLEDMLIQHSISLEGISQSVTNFVTDALNKELVEYDESIRDHIANAITDNVTNYITGESSYVNQKADEIMNVVGKNVFQKVKVRYIRDWLYSNDKDSQNRFAECKAHTATGANIAEGLLPKAFKSDLTEVASVSGLELYTDGTVNADYIYHADVSMLQLDLGEIREDIENIQIYHYYTDVRKNKSKLEISADGKNWTSVFDSDIDGKHEETSEGYVHRIQNQALSDQISYLKQTLSTINLTVQDSVGNYSSILQDMDSIKQTVEKNENDVKTVVSQVADVDEGWKVSMKKIGAYDGPEVDNIETCLSLNESGIYVTSSTKKGRKVEITPDSFTGYYNEGLSTSEDIKVFSLDEDSVYTNRLIAENGADLRTMKIVPVKYVDPDNNSYGGIAITKGGGDY